MKDGENGGRAVVAGGSIGIKREEGIAAVLLEEEEARGEGIGAVVAGGGVAEQIAVIEDVAS